MYYLLEKFKFFPTEFATDPLFMEIWGEEFWIKHGGTNAEILMAWLKAGEWPSYKDYNCIQNSFHSDPDSGGADSEGWGNGFGSGVGGGNSFGNGKYSYHFPVSFGHGFSFGWGNGSGRGVGRGYSSGYGGDGFRGQGRGCHSGDGDGDGNSYDDNEFLHNENNESYAQILTCLRNFRKVDFTTQFQKDQWVVTFSEQSTCIYGQYQGHCGREVWLNNTRQIWGWDKSNSIYDVLTKAPFHCTIRVGAFNPQPLAVLTCGVVIEVSERHVAALNAFPVDSFNEVPL